MAEEQVVVVSKTHTAEHDLVYVGTKGHVGHYLVIWLVRVGEKRNLLAGNQRVVKVDARDTRRDQLARLTTLVRVHRRTAYLSFFAFYLRAAVDGVSVGVDEAP